VRVVSRGGHDTPMWLAAHVQDVALYAWLLTHDAGDAAAAAPGANAARGSRGSRAARPAACGSVASAVFPCLPPGATERWEATAEAVVAFGRAENPRPVVPMLPATLPRGRGGGSGGEVNGGGRGRGGGGGGGEGDGRSHNRPRGGHRAVDDSTKRGTETLS